MWRDVRKDGQEHYTSVQGRETGVLILEGLNLSATPDGDYDLVCLPLPLAGVDGAPARATLLPAGTLG